MKKILVIDDDLNIQETLENILTQWGYSVIVAADGSSALKQISKNVPDLILMDIRLPDIDGISLFQEIHSLKETSKIPVIMLTAFSDLTTYHDAKLFGAVDYLVKPFELEVLKEKIEKNLPR